MITEDDIGILEEVLLSSNSFLTDKEKLAIQARYFENPPKKLREIADSFGGVSRQRVYAILRDAQRKISTRIRRIKELENAHAVS